MGVMPKRSSKPRDLNSMAAAIVAQSTTTDEPVVGEPKDQRAVESGRAGGLTGGRVRAAKLDPEHRSRIAKDAATARWRKSDTREGI